MARVNGQDTVTPYANAGERVTWPRGVGPILTGGRVGLMVRGGAAHDTDAGTEATESHLTASVASVASVVASVSGSVAPPQANTWYKLDVVVARVGGQDKVTLYANASERVTWTRGSGPILTGGRVGVMVRGGAAPRRTAAAGSELPYAATMRYTSPTRTTWVPAAF